ncbi:AbrB/MazE/SpoVT family DNA-binding domain-containing protein [Paraburkholderia sp. 22B1P]|uniref:AbrB/MazE/SpoVT family DNA-binding domain-containing protein n=1 Tax=Paraburkholderia sp. 22B1P TaxID=3080498 RepID=UPI0030CEEC75
MERSTVDENGCTTVPAPVREALNLHAGAVLDWQVMPGGVALVHPKRSRLKTSQACYKGTRRTPLSTSKTSTLGGIVKEPDIWHAAHNIASRPDEYCAVGVGALIKIR